MKYDLMMIAQQGRKKKSNKKIEVIIIPFLIAIYIFAFIICSKNFWNNEIEKYEKYNVICDVIFTTHENGKEFFYIDIPGYGIVKKQNNIDHIGNVTEVSMETGYKDNVNTYEIVSVR